MPNPRRIPPWAGPILVGIVYLVLAGGALRLTQGAYGIAAIWPASGVLLAALLLAPRARLLRYVAAGAAASVAANLMVEGDVAKAAALTAANMVESVLAWWLLCGRGGPRPGFADPAEIGRFCAAAAAAAAAAAVTAAMLTGSPDGGFVLAWFLTDLLGMLIVAPILLMAADATRGRGTETAVSRREAAALLLLVAAVALAVFGQSTYPLLFLPLVALLAATYRLGPIGAAAGVLLIAVVATAVTASGRGPIMLMHADVRTVSLFLQFYLLVLLGTALPLAALLATRNRLIRALHESNRLLNMAEQAAHVGHWRVDLLRHSIFWSPEVFRLHGRVPGPSPGLADAIAGYHPDDRARVVAMIERGLTGGDEAAFRFEARLLQPDGTVRHIVSHGHPDRTEDGQLIGLFGVVQDVTDRVHAAEALDRARAAAEAAADTDQLTGLASRRRALRVLDDAMAAARASGQPMSVAVFDVDHFKTVNDRFGHLSGDMVLRRIAQAAAAASRRADLVGRLGGEEFVLLLPGADAATATIIAERVRCAIEASRGVPPMADGAAPGPVPVQAPAVTVSIGVACLDGDASAAVLLNRADRALYDAKRAGRNRMRLAA